MLIQAPSKFLVCWINSLILILLVAAMLACEPSHQGGETDEPEIMPTPTNLMAEELAISTTDSGMPELVLPVPALNGEEKLAVIVFFQEGENIRIVAADSPPAYATVEPINIYKGTCGQLGGAVYALKGILDGHSTTMLNISMDKLYWGKYVLNIHESIARIGNSIACAEIPLETKTTVIVLYWEGSDDLAGYAGLVAHGETTRIAIKLNSPSSGPQSSVALIKGDCFWQEDAEYSLSKLADGLSITDINVSFEELLSSEFSIVLSNKSVNGSDHLACGNYDISLK